MGAGAPRGPGARSYRADALAVVPPGVPEQIDLLLPDEADWPDAARRALASRVRDEWPRDRSYGAVHTGVGLYVDYPLVTARIGRRVVVPVIGAPKLRVSGRLELREDEGAPRRVVLLLDVLTTRVERILLPYLFLSEEA